ncbi:MAG: excisionase family DNA-binding protein [Planctomycetaceae bacterium]
MTACLVGAAPREGFATMKEAAEFMAVSKSYLYRLLHDGSIPSAKFGSQYRVPWAWLLAQVQSVTATTSEVSQ